MGCYVTILFAHILVGAPASRHLRAAESSQVPLNSLPYMRTSLDRQHT